MSTSIKITRENGGIRSSLVNNDGVSALVAYMDTLPSGFTANDRIKEIASLDEAKGLGITADATDSHIKALHYHLRQAFRLNPSLRVYVAIYDALEEDAEYDMEEIAKVLDFAGGEIRQMVIWSQKEYKKTDVALLQEVASKAENEDKPLSIIYCPAVTDVLTMESGVAKGNKNVSVCIGEDIDESVKISGVTLTMAGIILGLISSAKVNESIAWVRKFDTGMYKPGFVDGKAYKDLSVTQMTKLEAMRLIFAKTFAGYSGSYISDSYTMDEATSDYNAIERVRTMDKAARGVRNYLLPFVGSPVEIDAQTGKIDAATIEMWKNEGNRFLEQMERDGELSGFEVYIDAEQNILSTSTIEIIIRNVPMGVARNIKIKMSYAESL